MQQKLKVTDWTEHETAPCRRFSILPSPEKPAGEKKPAVLNPHAMAWEFNTAGFFRRRKVGEGGSMHSVISKKKSFEMYEYKVALPSNVHCSCYYSVNYFLV